MPLPVDLTEREWSSPPTRARPPHRIRVRVQIRVRVRVPAPVPAPVPARARGRARGLAPAPGLALSRARVHSRALSPDLVPNRDRARNPDQVPNRDPALSPDRAPSIPRRVRRHDSPLRTRARHILGSPIPGPPLRRCRVRTSARATPRPHPAVRRRGCRPCPIPAIRRFRRAIRRFRIRRFHPATDRSRPCRFNLRRPRRHRPRRRSPG
jgi:hypothetical protein